MLEINKIYNEDCISTMSKMPDNFIDLIITSPPYDNLRKYNGYSFKFEIIAKELFRVTKNGGIIVWIVGDSTINGSETGTSFKQALYFKEIGFNLHDTMIYMKDNPPPVGGSNRYFSCFEYMFILTKGNPNTFNPLTEPRRNKHNDKRKVRYRPVVRNTDGVFTKKMVIINQDNVKLQNIWSYTVSGGRVAEEKIVHLHPAIFPEQLVSDHIISWSNKFDLIYDPFMGSGTTAKMAILNKRNFIGSEISKEYCDIAEERLENLKVVI